jgi:hypothetical protein
MLKPLPGSTPLDGSTANFTAAAGTALLLLLLFCIVLAGSITS